MRIRDTLSSVRVIGKSVASSSCSFLSKLADRLFGAISPRRAAASC